MWDIVDSKYLSDKKDTIDGLSYKQNQKELFEKSIEKNNAGPADFETAIQATGFGKFNILLLLAIIPCCWASGFDTATMSYILPAAECDLELSPFNKGTLNAIAYSGMITSAFMWGFLADTLGRKRLLLIGYLMAAFFDLICAFSVSFWMLLLGKYFNGFAICGPFAVLMSYLSELHCAQYRARVLLSTGIWFSVCNIIVPLIAWAIIPQTINIVIIKDTFVLHSWQVFLAISSLPGLFAGIVVIFFPESPKFLMSQGRNDKALEIFKKIYSINTGLPPDTFPIKSLIDETKLNQVLISTIDKIKYDEIGEKVKPSLYKKLSEGWEQLKPLFHQPYLLRMILIFTLQTSAILGLNTLRLWLPQLFAIVSDYPLTHENTEATLCEMLEDSSLGGNTNNLNSTITSKDCSTVIVNSDAYIKSIIVGMVQGTLYLVAGYVLDKFGKKKLLTTLFAIAGALETSLYWAKDSTTMLALSSLYCSIQSICASLVLQLSVDLVPTSLRTMSVSLTMMCGRSGALIGNLIFPVLLSLGCLPPFLLVGCSSFLCALLSFLAPSTDKKPLK